MRTTENDYLILAKRLRRKRQKRARALRLTLAALIAFLPTFFLTTFHETVSEASISTPGTDPALDSPLVLPPATTAGLKTRKPDWDANRHAPPERGTYKRFYRVTATAYRPIRRGIEGGRWTYTERDGRSAHGVAVDPTIIPLGSRLWIPGYGHAIADDTGGWIKGHRIDIRCQDEESMDRWGRRKLRVYVLEEPSH
jgi:3D (Asp-Asp-Asp) domain-containing protein